MYVCMCGFFADTVLQFRAKARTAQRGVAAAQSKADDTADYSSNAGTPKLLGKSTRRGFACPKGVWSVVESGRKSESSFLVLERHHVGRIRGKR